jgi:anti-anti-sigma regulatory factor
MVRYGAGGDHVRTAGADVPLEPGDHICAFVDGARDGLDVIERMVAAGVEAGDKVVVFTDAAPSGAVLDRLPGPGVGAKGQVQVMSARQTYLSNGRFHPRAAMDLLMDHIDRAARAGFAGLRLVGDMTWALAQPPPPDQLAGYERQVNQLFLDGQALAVCVYDRSAFSRDTLQQVACAHPGMAVAGVDREWTPLLRIRRTTDPYGLRLTGEADFSNHQALAGAVDAVVVQQPDPAVPIVVDLAGLQFADAASATLLGRLAQKAPAGADFTGCQRAVETVLDCLDVTRSARLRLTPAGGRSEAAA